VYSILIHGTCTAYVPAGTEKEAITIAIIKSKVLHFILYPHFSKTACGQGLKLSLSVLFFPLSSLDALSFG
jgi:hypothetical protein